MAKKSSDSQVNVAAINCDQTAVNTLAVSKFAFPYSIQDKTALVIQRIEYFPLALAQLNSTGDEVYMALLARQQVTNITDQTDPGIIDSVTLTRLDLGTAASGLLFQRPITRDFTTLQGGGLLVAPGTLWAGINSSGAAAVMGFWLRMYYTYQVLTPEEYWQLVESRNIISS